MLEVKSVRYVSGYKLELVFSDGTSGEADLEPELHGVLEPLRDAGIFSQAFVQDGTVNWQDGALDLAPERLYARAHRLPIPETLEAAEANEREVRRRQKP